MFASHESSQMEEEEDRPSASARGVQRFEDERRMKAETGKSDGWREVPGLGQCINTCRSEDECLQEVR